MPRACALVLVLLAALPVAFVAPPAAAAGPSEALTEAALHAMAEARDAIRAATRAGADESMVAEAERHLRNADVHLEHNRPDRAIDGAVQAVPWAVRALWDVEGRGAQAPDADYRARAQAAFDRATVRVADVSLQIRDLSHEAVGLGAIDLLLAAADASIQARFMLSQWAEVAKNWDRGQVAEETRNGLASYVSGAGIYMAVAESLVASAANDVSEPLVLPTAWEHMGNAAWGWMNATPRAPDPLFGPILSAARQDANSPAFIAGAAALMGHMVTFRTEQALDREGSDAFNRSRDLTRGLIAEGAGSDAASVRPRILRATEQLDAAENRTGRLQEDLLRSAQNDAIIAITFMRELRLAADGTDLGPAAGETSDELPPDDAGGNALPGWTIVGVLAVLAVGVVLLARTRRGV